jgi:seryl-tRNA synthetase
LNINYLGNKNERKLVHTVNGTALAVPRVILTILETYWDPVKQIVRMPEALKDYLPFDRIENKRTNIILG